MQSPLLPVQRPPKQSLNIFRFLILAFLVGGVCLYSQKSVESNDFAESEIGEGEGSCAFGGCKACVNQKYGSNSYQRALDGDISTPQSPSRLGHQRRRLGKWGKLFGACMSCCDDTVDGMVTVTALNKPNADVKPIATKSKIQTQNAVQNKAKTLEELFHTNGNPSENLKKKGMTYDEIQHNTSKKQPGSPSSMTANQGISKPNVQTISPPEIEDSSLPSWKQGLLQMHGSQGTAYFWGWNRPVGASDIRGLFKALLATRPIQSKKGIFIYSGTHGDKNGRFDFDSAQDSKTQCAFQEALFWNQDEAMISAQEQGAKDRGWMVALRRKEIYDARNDGHLVEILRELSSDSNYRHVIWAFCYSADGTNTYGKTTTQKVIAKKNFNTDQALWTAPTYPGV